MKILALDTATENCSAALWVDGVVYQRSHASAREHSERLLGMVDSVLAEGGIALAGLDLVAVDRGPGGFTGVRIAVGVAQGLAFGTGLPVMPVSSLAAVAAGARRMHRAERVLVALDARMDEIYTAALDFSGGHDWPVVALAARVCAPDALTAPAGDWFGAGPGWAAYRESLAGVRARLTGCDEGLLPDARDVAALAAAAVAAGEQAVDPAEVWPLYLRDRVAQPKPRPPSFTKLKQ